jgi:hypothetical protein
MMTKRSSHMPMFTTIEITNSVATELRTFRSHRSCGVRTLQRMSANQIHPYGPMIRFFIMNCSKPLPLYQAMKISIA